MNLIFRPRRRFCHRPSLNPEPSQKFTESNNVNNTSPKTIDRVGSKLNLKRDSKSVVNDEDTTTDWTPEIPFRNVSTYIIYLVIIVIFFIISYAVETL